MADVKRVKILVPGDDPPQIAGSPELDRLEPYGDVELYTDRPKDSEEKVSRAKDAQIIINTRGLVTWREEEFSRLPNLEMLTTCSIGTDSIDLESAAKRGIVICNQPGRTAPVVAEHMIGLMFAVAKRAAFFTSEMKRGAWTRMNNIMLQGKTLGIVGLGSIGAEMARLANAIGMKVMAWTFNPSEERAARCCVEFVSLDELLSAADVVSLNVKLTEDSKGLIGEKEIGMMTPGSILLNGSRGQVLDTKALAEALHRGHLAGAGIDVFEEEPVQADNPLLGCEHVVLTPHCADMTPEGEHLLNSGAVDNVIAYLQGKPQNRVT